MKHFLSTSDWTKSELQEILDFATTLKNDPFQPLLKNRSIAMLFFNPSSRTRTSFEVGINELSGTAIILQPGKDAWPIEFEDNSTAQIDELNNEKIDNKFVSLKDQLDKEFTSWDDYGSNVINRL